MSAFPLTETSIREGLYWVGNYTEAWTGFCSMEENNFNSEGLNKIIFGIIEDRSKTATNDEHF